MPSIHPQRLLESAQAGAAVILKHTDRMRRLAGSATATLATALARHPGFAQSAEALETAIRLVRAYARGSYRQIPYRSLLALTAGLLYFVSPFDAIPDFLVMIGFIDDLAVLTLVLRQIEHDLSSFRAWEARQHAATMALPRLLSLDSAGDTEDDSSYTS
jgi:uncharacterized membrane protein YkvA (DUF1232 family)